MSSAARERRHNSQKNRNSRDASRSPKKKRTSRAKKIQRAFTTFGSAAASPTYSPPPASPVLLLPPAGFATTEEYFLQRLLLDTQCHSYMDDRLTQQLVNHHTFEQIQQLFRAHVRIKPAQSYGMTDPKLYFRLRTGARETGYVDKYEYRLKLSAIWFFVLSRHYWRYHELAPFRQYASITYTYDSPNMMVFRRASQRDALQIATDEERLMGVSSLFFKALDMYEQKHVTFKNYIHISDYDFEDRCVLSVTQEELLRRVVGLPQVQVTLSLCIILLPRHAAVYKLNERDPAFVIRTFYLKRIPNFRLVDLVYQELRIQATFRYKRQRTEERRPPHLTN